jgi:hypothetical protein
MLPDDRDPNQNLVKQLSMEMLRSNDKENNDDGVYSYSVGKPRPPSSQKKFDTSGQPRMTTPNNPVSSRVLV